MFYFQCTWREWGMVRMIREIFLEFFLLVLLHELDFLGAQVGCPHRTLLMILSYAALLLLMILKHQIPKTGTTGISFPSPLIISLIYNNQLTNLNSKYRIVGNIPLWRYCLKGVIQTNLNIKMIILPLKIKIITQTLMVLPLLLRIWISSIWKNTLNIPSQYFDYIPIFVSQYDTRFSITFSFWCACFNIPGISSYIYITCRRHL